MDPPFTAESKSNSLCSCQQAPVGAGKLLRMCSLYTQTLSLKQKAKVYIGVVLRSPTVEGHRLKSHFPTEQNHQR